MKLAENQIMCTRTLSMLALLLACAPAPIPADPAEEKGRAIFTERDRLDHGFVDQRVSMKMTLRSPGGRESTRRISMSQLEGEPRAGDKALIVFQAPRDIEGTALLTHEALGSEDDSQWLYLPAYKRVKRIATGDRSGRFVGTEFSYEDLAGDKLEDFSYRYLGEDQYGKRRMHRIERIPLNSSSDYSRQETWVDPEHNQVVRALLYDKKGRHIKTFEATDWVRYKDRFWRPHTIVMTHVPSGRSTLLEASDYEFDTGMSDRDLSSATLRRIR